MWLYVTAHFDAFQRNIALRPDEHADALGKAERVARSLHAGYYQGEFNLRNLLITGSYAKQTAIRPTSDVDLMYFLPVDMLIRYNSYESGGQSALLQDVRATLLQTFPTTEIKADGQAIVVNYQSRRFEVVPAFIWDGKIYIADTSDGGRWKPTYPVQEAQTLYQSDVASQGHIKNLIKYAKVWKRMHEVPLKSIILEYAALHFVQQWFCLDSSLNAPTYWHDWLVRDFFEFLLRHDHLRMPDGEVILFGDGWRRKTESALDEAIKACDYERADQALMAEIHWKNIFGSQFPSLQQSPLQQLASRSLLTGI